MDTSTANGRPRACGRAILMWPASVNFTPAPPGWVRQNGDAVSDCRPNQVRDWFALVPRVFQTRQHANAPTLRQAERLPRSRLRACAGNMTVSTWRWHPRFGGGFLEPKEWRSMRKGGLYSGIEYKGEIG
jgi:hypothetical protein